MSLSSDVELLAEAADETKAIEVVRDPAECLDGFNKDVIIRNDPELLRLRQEASSAREVVRACKEALSDADHELRRIETRISERTKALVEAADAKIDWIGRQFPWDADLLQILTEKFKISSFRPLQREALNAALSRRDVLAVMPTGSGKSLVFQLASQVDRGITIVITPLVALMQDQTNNLRNLGISACMLEAATSKSALSRIFSEVLPPASKKHSKSRNSLNHARDFQVSQWRPRDSPAVLLYVTPERVAKSKKFLSRLEVAYAEDRIARFCFDEVHCISRWGHDFRHDYTQLGILRRHFPAVPIIGMTATATPKVIADISESLHIEPVVFRGSVDRPNLFYEVRQKSSENAKVIEDLVHLCNVEFKNQAGIIYVLSRKDAEDVARDLMTTVAVAAACYHGDMSSESRAATYQAWNVGSVQVVVATVAFGLGINKPNVRFVVHHCVASSLEGYYQESGRAGRDGKPARCILFWRAADLTRLSSFVADKGPARLEMLYDSCRYATGRSQLNKGLKIGVSLPGSGGFQNNPRKRKRANGERDHPPCRRAIIAGAFGETPPPRVEDNAPVEFAPGRDSMQNDGGLSMSSQCCDLCACRWNENTRLRLDVTNEAQSALRIVHHFSSRFPEEKLTLNALATDWGNSGPKGSRLRGDEPALPRIYDKETRLEILVGMLLEGALSEYHIYGMYAMQAYVQVGPGGELLQQGNLRIEIEMDGSHPLAKVGR